MIQIYGIPNCNTVKKALDWLNENEIEFTFHNFKKEGVSEVDLKKWIAEAGWEALVNKKGTTWRQLDEATQKSVINENTAIALMTEKASVIKRPVVISKNKILLGFDEAIYRNTFCF
jgi:arsenate reductase